MATLENVTLTNGVTLAPPFTGLTNTYTTPGSGTDTIPTGASQVVIEVWGGGGSGGGINYTSGSAGANGQCKFTYT